MLPFNELTRSPMMRRVFFAVLLSLFVLLPLSAANNSDDQPLYGFTAASSKTQREWENKFRAIPDPKILRDTMQRLSARPHHVGSPYDKQNAEWILAQFKSWGLDAQIETFEVLFPTPKERLLEMTAPTKFTAKLEEPAVAADPTSNQKSEQLPTYNAYSIDGDVTGKLVYVNYGLQRDYEELDRLGVSVKGAIVIARYGNSWRGIKPKIAAEHDAIGCIIYSDPRDDGYFEDDVFPNGPMRNENGVQRGSVMDAPIYPGDPTTPGVGSKGDVKRLALKDITTLTKIPTLPISYGDARPLLAALTGPMAPVSFRGALGQAYHVGPGLTTVHLKVQFNWDIKPVYNVIARIPGSEAPDQWIVRGNHHDAWVNGAEDPISGQIALLEEARALSELLKQGWKPKRTIIYCAWDGEEPMLLGSTEWAEYHGDELKQHGAIYINTDGNSRGYLGAQGSHSLEKFVNGVARDITDPEKNISVWKRAQAARLVGRGPDNADRKEARTRPDLRIGPLGSGSDYTAFIDHLGVASLNVGYGGEDEGGIYHSIYDDFYWYTHFADKDFVYGRAMAQTVGTMVMRFADADVLPYDFLNFADTTRRYSDELKKMLKDKQDEIRERNQNIEEGAYSAVSDPRRPTVAPPKEEVPPFINFAPLDNAQNTLERSAERYGKAVKAFTAGGGAAGSLKSLNDKLIQAERRLTNPDGLPRRPWYQHLIYAPGFYTGYGAKTLPGVREGIEEKRYQEAEKEIMRVAKALEDYATAIDAAAQELEKAGR
jgi:N-acetylated-alpha-linked acidic dipeptidase